MFSERQKYGRVARYELRPSRFGQAASSVPSFGERGGLSEGGEGAYLRRGGGVNRGFTVLLIHGSRKCSFPATCEGIFRFQTFTAV